MHRRIPVLAITLSALVTAGCSLGEAAASDKPGDYARDHGYSFTVDPDEMTASFAADGAIIDWKEETTLGYARSILESQCLRKSGISAPEPYNRDLELNEKLFFDVGPWTERMASTYGYEQPEDSTGKQALLSHGESSQAEEAIAACSASDDRLQGIEKALDELQLARDEVTVTDRGDRELDAAKESFRSCMTDRRYTFDSTDDSLIPREAIDAGRESEIRIALDHASCAESSDLASTWVAVTSDQQVDYLKKNASAIATLRSKHEPMLAAADEIVKSYGR